MVYRISALFLLFALAAVSRPLIAGSQMSSELTAEGILVSENGKPVLFLQKSPKSKDGQYERANYIFYKKHINTYEN